MKKTIITALIACFIFTASFGQHYQDNERGKILSDIAYCKHVIGQDISDIEFYTKWINYLSHKRVWKLPHHQYTQAQLDAMTNVKLKISDYTDKRAACYTEQKNMISKIKMYNYQLTQTSITKK